MPRRHRSVLAGAVLAATAFAAAQFAVGALAAEPVTAGPYQDALTEALAKSGGKPVLVDFYTDW